MSGSMKDALTKSGLAPVEEAAEKPTLKKAAWAKELPEDDGRPHVPFEAPALTKTKPRAK